MSGGGRRGFLLVAAVALTVLAARTFTPYDLQETDQGKQAQYALDLVQNGNWLAPGSLGEAATKPPLYTWLAGLAAAASGSLDRVTLRVPTALAALGLVLTTWEIARRLAGARVAAGAAVALATSHHFLHLSGVVRTDGLLSFLLAAQLLVHVAHLGRDRAPWSAVAIASVLAAAACLTKGPAGLLSCGVVAVHLATTGRRARALREAAVPALVGAAVLAAWFLAASAARSDVVSTMLEGEAARHAVGEGFPNPLYYVLAMPPRLGPWMVLAVPAVVLAARAVRRPEAGPAPEIARLALCWLAVHLSVFSLFPHQRPDLIYPAEPAAMLLVGALLDRPFPAWAPRALACACAAAAVACVAGAKTFVPEAPAAAIGAVAALLAAGTGAAIVGARRDAAVAAFAALAAFGLSDGVLQTLGEAPAADRRSTERFAALARAEAARRGVPLVATGFELTAALFDLGITEPPRPPRTLAARKGPLLAVTVEPSVTAVARARGRPCAILARHAPPDSKRPPLVLLECP